MGSGDVTAPGWCRNHPDCTMPLDEHGRCEIHDRLDVDDDTHRRFRSRASALADAALTSSGPASRPALPVTGDLTTAGRHPAQGRPPVPIHPTTGGPR